MMACVLLVRMQFANSAAAAIERYNQVRVHDLRGLTVISQRKWVKYYEQLRSLSLQSPRAAIDEPGFVLKELSIQNTLTAVTPPQLRLRVYQLDNASASKVRLCHGTIALAQALCYDVCPSNLHMLVMSCIPLLSCQTLLHQALGYEQFSLREEIRGSILIEFKLIQCSNCRVQKHFKIWFNTLFVAPGGCFELLADTFLCCMCELTLPLASTF